MSSLNLELGQNLKSSNCDLIVQCNLESVCASNLVQYTIRQFHEVPKCDDW